VKNYIAFIFLATLLLGCNPSGSSSNKSVDNVPAPTTKENLPKNDSSVISQTFSPTATVKSTFAFDIGFYKGENSTHKCEVGLISNSPLTIRHYRCKKKGNYFYNYIVTNYEPYDSSYDVGNKKMPLEKNGEDSRIETSVSPTTFSSAYITSTKVYMSENSYYFKDVVKQKVLINYLDQNSIKFHAEIEDGTTFDMTLTKVSINVPDIKNSGPYADKIAEEGWFETGKFYKCSGNNQGHADSLSIYQMQNSKGEIGYYSDQKLDTSKDLYNYDYTSARWGFYYPTSGSAIDQSVPGQLTLRTDKEAIVLEKLGNQWRAEYHQITRYQGSSSAVYNQTSYYRCDGYGFEPGPF